MLELDMKLAQTLAQPEPLPSLWEFKTSHSKSLGDDGLTAQPLGDSPSVPRFLRYSEPVDFFPLTVAETERAILEVWRGKRLFDSQHGPTSLHAYLYRHWSEHQAAGAALDRAAAVTEGYQLCHATMQHRAASPFVQLFFSVLAGHLPDAAYRDQQIMLQGLLQTVTALAGNTGAVDWVAFVCVKWK